MSGIIGGAGSKSGVIGETEIDYEEGIWSPTYSNGTNTTNVVMNTGTNKAYYTKIGRQVNAYGRFEITNKGSVDGNCRIGGLPICAGSYDTSGFPVLMFASGVSHSGAIQAHVYQGDDFWDLAEVNDSGTRTALTRLDIIDTMFMMFSVIYLA